MQKRIERDEVRSKYIDYKEVPSASEKSFFTFQVEKSTFHAENGFMRSYYAIIQSRRINNW